MASRTETQSQIDQRIKTAFAVAVVLSLLAFLVEQVPIEEAESFWAGFKEGIQDSSVCRSVIGAATTAAIFAFRPSRWTFFGATCFIAVALTQSIVQVQTFPTCTDAAKTLLPMLAFSSILSPASWLEYFCTYRAIVAPNSN